MQITRQFLEEIFQEQICFGRSHANLKLVQRSETTPDDSGYNVVFDIIMEPNSNEKMRSEVWLTDDGYVSIGLESYQRLATRTSLRPLRQGFAAGHEPLKISKRGLRSLIAAVANRSIAISFTHGLNYMLSTHAVASAASIQALKDGGYHHLSWIRLRSQLPKLMVERKAFSGTARYAPWSSI